MSTVATVHYAGTYKGAPVSGSVPVWSRFNSADEVGRLLYAVITGRSLHKEGGRVNWSMGESDFVAWVPSPKKFRPAPFLRFTFRVESEGADAPLYVDGKSPAIRAFEHLDRLAEHPINLPTERKPTSAPTFTDDVPECVFDILATESGTGARSIVVYRGATDDVLSWREEGADLPGIFATYAAWAIFSTADGWHWRREGSTFDPALYDSTVNPFFE